MNQQEYETALAKLNAAITDQAGELLSITRIDFELLDRSGSNGEPVRTRRVRWNLWQDSRRLYTATGDAGDVAGFLAASKMILEMRAGAAVNAPSPPAPLPRVASDTMGEGREDAL